MIPDTAQGGRNQYPKIPVILCNEAKADLAYQAHCALILLENLRPDLGNNPYWVELKKDAYERFYQAFEAVE